MCSVNDEEGAAELMVEKEVLSAIGSTCKKCLGHASEVVLRGRDPYCRICFLAYATHKFRGSLGKSKMVRRGDKILVGFSGSASSLALLHLIKEGIEEAAHKKLVFEPFIVYIDEGAVTDNAIEERRRILKDIILILEQFNLPSCISNLEFLFQSIESPIYYDRNTELPMTSNSNVSRLFTNLKNATSKEDLLSKLRNKLLLKIAAESGCCKILTAETLASTATKLLSNISLGRGGQLPFDGFCDNRDKNVKILRPLQDFGTDEIDFYNTVHDLKLVNTSFIMSKDNKTITSIQMLTKRFVDDLQENFPSTLSTVYRTGAKLNIDSEAVQSSGICSLCMGPIDTDYLESSSLQATKYSSFISKSGASSKNIDGSESDKEINPISNESEGSSNGKEINPISNESEGSCNKVKENCKCNSSSQSTIISKKAAMESLCYGCSLIANDLESLDVLPQDIMNSILENCTFQKMRNEIQDFLL